MKKFLLIACMALLGVCSVSAQENKEYKRAIGISAGYVTSVNGPMLSAKFVWNLKKKFRIEPTVNCIFGKDLTAYNGALNFKYMFPIKGFRVYPVIGVGLGQIEPKEEYKVQKLVEGGGEFFTNFGAGIEYDYKERWILNAEISEVAGGGLDGDCNGVSIMIGAAYKF
ncbi:MAG: outer membrane beta-barrel protein [Muribaculaceae bacterium]|nr:outer membrane beta-barrel protein [Muribaculaceae bacterium]